MSEENNENLQNEQLDNTIVNTAIEAPVSGAGVSTPEDAPNAYEAIIQQQQDTIDALLKRTEDLTGQITQLINMGVQINDGMQSQQTQQMQQDSDMPEDYVPLAQLGAEIGKR